MKKPILSRWLLTALAALTVVGAQAASKRFTAVTSNVDGLPPSVEINYVVGKANPTMNADGSQEPGATRMGQLFAENLWDIIALSEDFNYHNYIMDGVNTYYNAAKHRGKIEQNNLDGSLAGYLTQSVRMNTDGLCMLTRKKYKVYPQADQEGDGDKNKGAVTNWVLWNDHYGYTDNEADGLIRKGFRFYQVTLAEGLVVDVYITHMEAGSTDGDNAARAKQLTQFAEYIKAHKGSNPIIILGDTNCRYTRDPIYDNFIAAIEQDKDLTVKDPWVEIIRNGDYPVLGTGSIMTSAEGPQKGEIVDKIFYINNKQSKSTLTCEGYLHDTSFTYADGSQIADHCPVVGTFVIENEDAPEPSTGFDIPAAPAKGNVVSGQTYYVRNLGSGKFLRAGGAWTTQAVLGDYPSKVTPTSKGGNSWSLKTTHDNRWIRWDGNNYFMDQDENTWTLTPVADKPGVYTMVDASSQAVGFNGNVLAPVTANSSDPNQQWEFLTQADLLHELYYASSATPKDVTFLMKAPDFGYADKEDWTSSVGSSTYVKREKIRVDASNNASCYKIYNSQGGIGDRSWKLSQTITGLPAGTYKVTYQMLTYVLAAGGNHSFTINGQPAPWTNVSSDPGNATVLANLAAGQYAHEFTVTVANDGTYANKIEIKVDKTDTNSATGGYYDNFNIKCLALDGIPDLSMYDRVKEAIDNAQQIVDDNGIQGYRNGQVVALWEAQEIVGDGWAEIRKTYKNLAEAVLRNTEIPADYTYALVNPSFELYPDYKDSRYNIGGAFPFGWSYPNSYAYDSGVWPASDNYKHTNNPDGERIFNTWDNGNGGNTVYQEVTLTPGLYRLTARVASDAGNKVYLYAGSKNAAVTTTGSGDLVDVALNFSVSDGKPFNIGVAGANNGAFATEGGNWYKADDFHLTRIGDAETIKGMEMLQLAINEATTRVKALNKYDSKWADDMARYQAMIDNYTLEGNGLKEFNEVYDLLRVHVFAQPTKNASGQDIDVDYTYAIANNSFEWGNYYGWDLASTAGDTGVKPNSDATYTMSSCDGTYVFNTWQDGRGTKISQTINNLPAGHYRLRATFANDPNSYVYLEIIGQEGVASQKGVYTISSEKNVGEVETLEFEVAEGTPSITIVAGGCNSDGSWDDFGGNWYKVDNFRLTRTGEPNTCFFYQRLQAAIDETTEEAQKLPEKYRSQWDAHDYQDLIDRHIDSGHDEETMHGSGIDEINELFQRLRDLIFSQTETGADMSGAITNNSFELGDLTGWTAYMEPIADAKVTIGTPGTPTYGTEGTDGKYLYNAYYGDRLAHPIYQVIPNVPSGVYTLKVKIASDLGAKFFLGANAKHSDIIYIPESGVEGLANEAMFHDFEFTFEVPVEAESKDVKIGVYPTTVGSADEIGEAQFADDVVGPWYKVDDFRLILESRYMEVDWEMESDTHGTIMLPFAVDKATLDEMNLEPYTIKMATESSNHTPADEDINTYRLLTWDGPHNGILANVPYVLKNVAPQAEAAANKVRAKAGEADAEEVSTRLYKFTGYTNKTPEDVISPEGNLLTGTLVELPAEQLQHHFAQVDDNVGFVLHQDADDNHVSHETIPAYHAYIELPTQELVENGHIVSGFYFFEPTQYLEWFMETDNYGTLILPFDAPLPDGLKAYRLLSADHESVKSVNLGETDGETYQLINLTEVTETMEVTDEEGNVTEKVKISANTPYLIERTSAAAPAKRRATAKADEAETEGIYTFAGIATNTEESYKLEGLMTGVIVSRDDKMGIGEDGSFTHNSLDSGDRVLTGDAENGYRFEAVTDRTALPRYHAYIDSETMNGDNALATHVLFAEPDYTVEWTMEGGQYGTIILPFEANVPEDLEAYTLSTDGMAEAKDMPGEAGKTYQVLTQAEANTLEAHLPYLLVVKSEPTETEPEVVAMLSATAVVNGDVYEFTGKRGGNEVAQSNGALTGTYSAAPAAEGDYQLSADGKGFTKLPEEGSTVNSLHAYIKSADAGTTADYLLLAEPEDEENTGIDAIMAGEYGNVDVYDLRGVLLQSDVTPAEGLRTVAPGIYILRAGDRSVKVLK